jgi:hypothetical protein
MKKITALLTLITLLSFVSDEGVLFKVQYKPETKYSETLEQSSQTTIKYHGDDAFLERLEDKGIKNPTITDKSSKTIAEFKTGKLTDGIHFPLTMNFISTTSSDGKQTIPDGTIIYGKSAIDSMPTLDSIFSPGMDDDVKQLFLKTMVNLFNQLTFPAKKLNVGDTFTHELPVSIPMGGLTIKMAISTVYKLMSIDNGIANFDITQVYNMTLDEYTTEGNGSGKGQIKYDIANKFYTYYQETSEMTLKMKMEGFSLDLSSKSSYTQNISFSKN